MFPSNSLDASTLAPITAPLPDVDEVELAGEPAGFVVVTKEPFRYKTRVLPL